MDRLLRSLNALPRLGWVTEPSPVRALDVLQRELKLDWLGVKRDDRLGALHGGSKVRKLDYLLATEPFASAQEWASIGATGSGHLVAMTAAAAQLQRQLSVYCFWQPPIRHVVDNLAFTASGPTRIHAYRSRLGLAVRHPGLVVGGRVSGAVVVPPGASCPAGIVGMVRAGVELAVQIESGVLPRPDSVYVALGSGGTAAGLALGLAMAGCSTTVRAVAVTEWPFASASRLQILLRSTVAGLRASGVDVPPGLLRRMPPIDVVRGFVGSRYGVATRAALNTAERVAASGLELEPIYTAKAMAALIEHASKVGTRKVLFWMTARGSAPLPHRADWQASLPGWLRDRLDAVPRRPSTRRRFVSASMLALSASIAGVRVSGYPQLPKWSGAVLSNAEARVVFAAAEALLPPAPDAGAYREVVRNVDRYVATLPGPSQTEIHALLAAAEHGAPIVALRARRLTRLKPSDREACLSALGRRGGVASLIYRGLRDLCMLGYYQQSNTWSSLEYPGPWVRSPTDGSRYEALRAPTGAQPAALVS